MILNIFNKYIIYVLNDIYQLDINLKFDVIKQYLKYN